MKAPRITARSPEVQQQYDDARAKATLRYGDTPPCVFCSATKQQKALHTTETMLVLKNDYPYSRFDGLEVKNHLMIVPRRHHKSIGVFNDMERKEYLHLVAVYHARGYATMTRSSTDTHRSVPAHLHTHLFRYGAELVQE